jgi:hypothetical protein
MYHWDMKPYAPVALKKKIGLAEGMVEVADEDIF